MNGLRGFVIIIGFDGLGWMLHSAGFPLPAHVIGLLLLTAALFLRVVKLEWVESAASLLTRHLMLFFVPLLAGVSTFAGVLTGSWLVVTAGIVAGTSAVMLLTAGAVKLLTIKRSVKGDVPHEQRQSFF